MVALKNNVKVNWECWIDHIMLMSFKEVGNLVPSLFKVQFFILNKQSIGEAQDKLVNPLMIFPKLTV